MERLAARGHKIVKAVDAIADIGLVGSDEVLVDVEHVMCVSWKSLLYKYKPSKWSLVQLPYDMCALVQFNHLPVTAQRPNFVKFTGSPILGVECQEHLMGQGYEPYQHEFTSVMWRKRRQEGEEEG